MSESRATIVAILGRDAGRCCQHVSINLLARDRRSMIDDRCVGTMANDDEYDDDASVLVRKVDIESPRD
jgi:hypothetical protein